MILGTHLLAIHEKFMVSWQTLHENLLHLQLPNWLKEGIQRKVKKLQEKTTTYLRQNKTRNIHANYRC